MFQLQPKLFDVTGSRETAKRRHEPREIWAAAAGVAGLFALFWYWPRVAEAVGGFVVFFVSLAIIVLSVSALRRLRREPLWSWWSAGKLLYFLFAGASGVVVIILELIGFLQQNSIHHA